MSYELFLGIDVSKKTFDYSLIDSEGTILSEGQLLNDVQSIRTWLMELKENFKIKSENLLTCMEQSGYYSNHLLIQIHQSDIGDIWLESALQIKRSMGIVRGKSDKVDALRIAIYALDFQRRAKLWSPPDSSVERLSLLLSHRNRLVKNRLSILQPLKEQTGFILSSFQEEMDEAHKDLITSLNNTIDSLNNKIEALLNQDKKLNRQSKIIRSIPGFGTVIASKILISTAGFSKIDSARKLACYAGVAPFEYRSGTSIKGKTRVSHLANKDLKKMFHLAALVTIRKGNVMHTYYKRKVAQGKNKMSVINAVRNKLIHIMMACIDNDTIYQKNYKHSLDIT